MIRSDVKDKASRKRQKTRAAESATSAALVKTSVDLEPAKSNGEPPVEHPEVDEKLQRVRKAFATTDSNLTVSLLVQTKLAAGFDINSIVGHDYAIAAVGSANASTFF